MTTTMIRRIEVANLNIAMTGTGKIVFSCKTTPGLHYTVNLGGKSGVFGFHKTTEGPNRGYETLGAARPEDLIAALEPITNQLVPELLAAVRPRRLGFIITILESSPDCFQTSTALRLERREAHCSCRRPVKPSAISDCVGRDVQIQHDVQARKCCGLEQIVASNQNECCEEYSGRQQMTPYDRMD